MDKNNDFGIEKKLIIVTPVYNEEAVIDVFFSRTRKLNEKIQITGVVIVDDGSVDQTVSRIEKISNLFPAPIRIVRLSRNYGHQNACIAGIKVAIEWANNINTEWIGLIDADLQDDPVHFLKLMAESENHDVVYAVRKSRKEGILIKFLSALFYRIISLTSTFPIPNDAGTFSIMRVPVARIICASGDNDPYFPGLRASIGFRQKSVPLDRKRRAGGKSKVRMSGLIMLSLRAAILYSNLIFNFILFSGIIIFCFSLLISMILVVLRLTGHIDIPGATTIVIIGLLSLGILMVFLGLIAHMINRVKVNTSKQNPWIIMEDKMLGK